MSDLDTISYILAAERDASVKDLPAYAEALARVEAEPALAAVVEAERVFYQHRDGLLDDAGMPAETRMRLQRWVDETFNASAQESAPAEVVRPAPAKTIAFPRSPRNFATLAAALALLLGGTALVFVMNQEHKTQQLLARATLTDFDAFRAFGSELIAKGVTLEHRSPVIQTSFDYLDAKGAPAFKNVAQILEAQEAMGCAVYEVDGVKVSLICMRMTGDQIVHLFAAPLKWKARDPANSIKVVNGRETRAWQAGPYAYVLVAHDEGQRLGSG
jgi:hypothetical protein